MGEEQDSWFKQAFGVDLGQAADAVAQQAAGVAEQVQTQVAQTVQQAQAVVAEAAAPVENVVAQGVALAGESTSPGTASLGGLIEQGKAVVAQLVERGEAEVDHVEEQVVQVVQQVKEVVEPVLDEAVTGAQQLVERLLTATEGTLQTPGLAAADLQQDTDPPPGNPPAADPTFVDIDRPFRVFADNPIEFINQANTFMGQDAAAHMETADLSIAQATLDQSKRVVTTGLVVTTTTKRPSWAGGRPIGAEKTVIEKAEALIQAHEERHRQIMKDGMAKAAAEIRGKPGSQADKILTRWIAQVDKDQNALDAREGKIIAIQGDGKITDVQLVPR